MQIVVCKFTGNRGGSPPAAAAAALAALSAPPASLSLPPDPLRFAASPGAPLPPLGSETTLRVAIEVRRGAWRTMRNAEVLVAACEAANAAGEVVLGSTHWHVTSLLLTSSGRG